MASKHRQEQGEMGERSVVPVGLENIIHKQQDAPTEEGAAFGTRDRIWARGSPPAVATVIWCVRKDEGSSCDSDADGH